VVAPLKSFNRSRTSRQNISRANIEEVLPLKETITYCELDSHADTSCAGSNFKVIGHTNKICDAAHFSNHYDVMKRIPIVKAGTAYDSPNGRTYIHILNQALCMGDYLDNALLCPNQIRSHDVIVDDVPEHLSPDPIIATHSIYFPKKHVRIPLKPGGCISRIPKRLPTQKEIEECEWLILTSGAEWNPHSEDFELNKHLIEVERPNRDCMLFALHTNSNCEISKTLSYCSSLTCEHFMYQTINELPRIAY
jgi:hypothetical protein